MLGGLEISFIGTNYADLSDDQCANLKHLNCMEEAVGFIRGLLMFVL
jgi:hypothetical protein